MTPTKPARKTAREAFPAAAALRENLDLLMSRNRESRNDLAKYLRMDITTLRRRLEDPTLFQVGELEMIALRFDVTVSQLMKPAVFVEDTPITRT